MDRFHLIRVFVAVVQAKGLAGAARTLSISAPAVTRAVQELEDHLGVRLLARTTRSVHPTEAGERYFEDCRRILAEMAEADESAAGTRTAARGHLTVTAPALFGSIFVTPIVTEYLNLHAEVSVSCWFVDRVVNLVEEGVDAALRIGELEDSSIQALRVGQVRRVICAAPGYLARRGRPRVLDDLQGHDIIQASGVTPAPQWRLRDNGTPRVVKLEPRLISTSNDAALAAAVEGFGLVQLLSYQVAAALREGRLEILLADFEPASLPVHLLHREGRHASQKVRAFIDLAVERLRAQPALR